MPKAGRARSRHLLHRADDSIAEKGFAQELDVECSDSRLAANLDGHRLECPLDVTHCVRVTISVQVRPAHAQVLLVRDTLRRLQGNRIHRLGSPPFRVPELQDVVRQAHGPARARIENQPEAGRFRKRSAAGIEEQEGSR